MKLKIIFITYAKNMAVMSATGHGVNVGKEINALESGAI